MSAEDGPSTPEPRRLPETPQALAERTATSEQSGPTDLPSEMTGSPPSTVPRRSIPVFIPTPATLRRSPITRPPIEESKPSRDADRSVDAKPEGGPAFGRTRSAILRAQIGSSERLGPQAQAVESSIAPGHALYRRLTSLVLGSSVGLGALFAILLLAGEGSEEPGSPEPGGTPATPVATVSGSLDPEQLEPETAPEVATPTRETAPAERGMVIADRLAITSTADRKNSPVGDRSVAAPLLDASLPGTDDDRATATAEAEPEALPPLSVAEQAIIQDLGRTDADVDGPQTDPDRTRSEPVDRKTAPVEAPAAPTVAVAKPAPAATNPPERADQAAKPESADPLPARESDLPSPAQAIARASFIDPNKSILSTEPESATGPTYGVQLVAVSREEAANRAWQIYQEDYGNVLGDLEPAISRADVAGGTVYRLQVGAFPDRAEATALCTELKEAGGDCLVLSR